MAADGLLKYLGPALRRRREASDVLIAEVLATLRRDSGRGPTSDGALSRFERGETTPNYLDDVIRAYARETGASEVDLWLDAMGDWAAAADAVPAEAGAELDWLAQNLAVARAPQKRPKTVEAQRTSGKKRAAG